MRGKLKAKKKKELRTICGNRYNRNECFQHISDINKNMEKAKKKNE